MASTDRSGHRAVHARVLYRKEQEATSRKEVSRTGEEGGQACREVAGNPSMEKRWLALGLPLLGVDGRGQAL